MSKNIAPGFFTEEIANQVWATKNIFEAKRIAHQAVIDYVKAHPLTELKNIANAERDINRCARLVDLTKMIYDYMLKHPSEGLGVLK
jgi:hypothetical protein